MSTFIRTLLIGIALLGLGAEVDAQANDVDCIKCVDARDIAPEAVNSNKIKQHAVTTEKLAKQAVTSGKIAPAAVGTGKIKNGAVTLNKLSPELASRIAALEARVDILENPAKSCSATALLDAEGDLVACDPVPNAAAYDFQFEGFPLAWHPQENALTGSTGFNFPVANCQGTKYLATHNPSGSNPGTPSVAIDVNGEPHVADTIQAPLIFTAVSRANYAFNGPGCVGPAVVEATFYPTKVLLNLNVYLLPFEVVAVN